MQDTDWSLYRGGSVQPCLVSGIAIGTSFNSGRIISLPFWSKWPGVCELLLRGSYPLERWGKSGGDPSLQTFLGLPRRREIESLVP